MEKSLIAMKIEIMDEIMKLRSRNRLQSNQDSLQQFVVAVVKF